MPKAKQGERPEPAIVVWEGDSKEVLKSFPKKIRAAFGLEIRCLQDADMPTNSRPMQSIGKRVYELRQMDSNGWYRVIYLQRIAGRLFMLHSFVKKSAKTSQRDVSIARQRLKDVQARLAEEKKNG